MGVDEEGRFCVRVLSITDLLTRPEGRYVELDLPELDGALEGADLRIVGELVRGVTRVRDLVLGGDRRADGACDVLR